MEKEKERFTISITNEAGDFVDSWITTEYIINSITTNENGNIRFNTKVNATDNFILRAAMIQLKNGFNHI